MSTDAVETPNVIDDNEMGLRDQKVKYWDIPGLEEPIKQDPLTFFEKNELVGVVLNAFSHMQMSGISFDEIMNLMNMDADDVQKLRSGEMDMSMVPAIRDMINLVLKAGMIAPQLIEDLFMIILSIPPGERPLYRDIIREIDDDIGFGIIDTFIEQNARTIKGFLSRWRATISKAASTPTGPKKKGKAKLNAS